MADYGFMKLIFIPEIFYLYTTFRKKTTTFYGHGKHIFLEFFPFSCQPRSRFFTPMAQVGIREFDAKEILRRELPEVSGGAVHISEKRILVTPETDWKELQETQSWITQEKLVAKPDQLFGKRGKHGLIGLNLDAREAQEWIAEKAKNPVNIGKASGMLTHFLVEPFTPHDEEYYVSIRAERDKDVIAFSTEGGIEIEENWEKVIEIPVGILENIEDIDLAEKLPKTAHHEKVVAFITALYKVFTKGHFAFLEINPFTFVGDEIVALDAVAKVDDTAAFECRTLWGDIEFPVPFGRNFTKEEQYIRGIDENTGASLKLTILNPKGKIWTMVAGGGASVIYADTISDLGYGKEMANYGEYSGDPSREDTRAYAETIFDLMTREQAGKALIIGGGIANFTDVAKTFTGIIEALQKYAEKLKAQQVKVYVRRGGPNYEEGLRRIKKAADDLGITMQVYGPETHMTSVVRMAVENVQ